MFNKLKKTNSNTPNVRRVNDYFCITNILNHATIKERLLEAIEYEKDTSLKVNNSVSSITSTDYFNDKQHSHYKDIFLSDVVNKNYQSIANKLCCDSYTVANMWYQQYYEDDEHAWHVHPDTSYANVYFLELPSKEIVTEFLDIQSKKPFTLNNIKEGDLLTFPGHVIHRSPKNKTTDRKTVIAFNTMLCPMVNPNGEE